MQGAALPRADHRFRFSVCLLLLPSCIIYARQMFTCPTTFTRRPSAAVSARSTSALARRMCACTAPMRAAVSESFSRSCARFTSCGLLTASRRHRRHWRQVIHPRSEFLPSCVIAVSVRAFDRKGGFGAHKLDERGPQLPLQGGLLLEHPHQPIQVPAQAETDTAG